MSFDAFTIAGILTAILAGGFFIVVVSRNDEVSSGSRRPAARGRRR
jgi:hypothetical protein